jgi:hypothetical protein
MIFFDAAAAQISFQNIPEQLGINVICENAENGSGITFFDYDNDGWDDLSIATAENNTIRFFKNINGFFAEQNINIDNSNSTKQINWIDIDNDGDHDLFITSDDGGNTLYENLGNMVMQDITLSSGIILDSFPYYGASWGDYNNDGFLDVFISIWDSETPNILYKNNGDKTFTIVNNEVGLSNDAKLSFCAAFLDYDNDGDQDIYVANDRTIYTNDFYRNNGDGTFTEVGALTGTDLAIGAMSVTVDDYNSDGWLDIYVTNEPDGNVLLKNNGNGTFTNVAAASQVEVNSDCWGAIFLDADNDTDFDLYVSCEQNGSNPSFLSSAFFINNGHGIFTMNNAVIPGDFAKSYSNAIGDINNDGYTDFVVNNINHPNISVWKNQTPQTNNWLKVKLEGTVSNRNGVGSLIEISINGEKQYRYTLIGEGYLSQNSGTEIFGIGTASNIDYVKVKWLSGLEDILYDVAANQTLTIVEGATLSMTENRQPQFSYYPNPVKNTLTLKAASTNIETVIVSNLLGQQVMKLQPDSVNCVLDMSNLPAGTYILRASVDNATETLRVVKQ